MYLSILLLYLPVPPAFKHTSLISTVAVILPPPHVFSSPSPFSFCLLRPHPHQLIQQDWSTGVPLSPYQDSNEQTEMILGEGLCSTLFQACVLWGNAFLFSTLDRAPNGCVLTDLALQAWAFPVQSHLRCCAFLLHLLAFPAL